MNVKQRRRPANKLHRWIKHGVLGDASFKSRTTVQFKNDQDEKDFILDRYISTWEQTHLENHKMWSYIYLANRYFRCITIFEVNFNGTFTNIQHRCFVVFFASWPHSPNRFSNSKSFGHVSSITSAMTIFSASIFLAYNVLFSEFSIEWSFKNFHWKEQQINGHGL